jgi:predicted dehydrogenase
LGRAKLDNPIAIATIHRLKSSGRSVTRPKKSGVTVVAKRPTEQPKLRVAFIGAGGIAGTHMKFFSASPRVQIVAMADPSDQAMDARAKDYTIPERFKDYKQMLAQIKPDVVSVCTPNGLHCENTIAALQAGAHVIVEKPMAMNAQEAQSMIDAAKKAKKKLVIGFQMRYSPNARFLRQQVEEGRFGKIMYARAQAIRRRGIPNWGVFGRKELQGGGPMIDIGVHIMEVAHYVMGSPRPIAATGQTFTYMGNKKSDVVSQWPNWDHKTYTVEDLAVGQIRFDNGAIMTIESSFVAHCPGVFNFQLLGEKAGGNYDPPTLWHDHGGYMLNSAPDFIPKGDFMDNFQAKINNFIAHIADDAPSLAPAEHGLMVQKMLDGVYRSAEKGKEVAID